MRSNMPSQKATRTTFHALIVTIAEQRACIAQSPSPRWQVARYIVPLCADSPIRCARRGIAASALPKTFRSISFFARQLTTRVEGASRDEPFARQVDIGRALEGLKTDDLQVSRQTLASHEITEGIGLGYFTNSHGAPGVRESRPLIFTRA